MVICSPPETDDEFRNQAFKVFGTYPCLWQIKAARAVLEGKDVLTIAPTGAGKSFAYWLCLAFIQEGTMIVVTPLKELGAQFEAQLNTVGYRAFNVTARNATDEVYKDIAKLHYRVVIFSPETMAKDHRYDVLLHNRIFMRSVINIVIDESHVIREWGGTFRPEYHALGPSRYALPRRIPYHLGTATLPIDDAAQLKEHLNLGPDATEIRLDTDRKNIFHRVQKMKHPVNSYRDLAPLISQCSDAPRAKKFLVFFNSRNAAQEGAEFLRARLSESEVEQVKWIHSGMTDEFRHNEVHALKVGDRLGACATDAVGMGIDIPDVYVVVQYGVPVSLSAWYQRLGRAVRDLTLDGCAILLAEPSNFDDAKHAAAQASKDTAERNRLERNLAEAAAAEAREIQRASLTPVTTSITQSQKRKLNEQAARSRKKTRTQDPVEPDLRKPETLDFNGYGIKIERSMDDYINAENRPGKKCRREIGCVYFGNIGLSALIPYSHDAAQGSTSHFIEPVTTRFCCTRSGCSPHPIKHCCDLCEPEYWPFSTAETFPIIKQTRMPNPKAYERGDKEKKLWGVLNQERNRWFLENYGQHGLITPNSLWPDENIDRIVDWAHENKLISMDDFRKRMSWAFTEELGGRILQLIRENYQYQMPAPKPRKPRNPLALPNYRPAPQYHVSPPVSSLPSFLSSALPSSSTSPSSSLAGVGVRPLPSSQIHFSIPVIPRLPSLTQPSSTSASGSIRPLPSSLSLARFPSSLAPLSSMPTGVGVGSLPSSHTPLSSMPAGMGVGSLPSSHPLLSSMPAGLGVRPLPISFTHLSSMPAGTGVVPLPSSSTLPAGVGVISPTTASVTTAIPSPDPLSFSSSSSGAISLSHARRFGDAVSNTDTATHNPVTAFAPTTALQPTALTTAKRRYAEVTFLILF
ncbi:P-loop containing nucleoside triphosphate hydrolase protein [Lentinula raphanica]|nr:P-loop containing nucleoside triphosphate hydrolase protein [Lentinula raphanica]